MLAACCINFNTRKTKFKKILPQILLLYSILLHSSFNYFMKNQELLLSVLEDASLNQSNMKISIWRNSSSMELFSMPKTRDISCVSWNNLPKCIPTKESLYLCILDGSIPHQFVLPCLIFMKR